jgi:hypothetical protein
MAFGYSLNYLAPIQPHAFVDYCGAWRNNVLKRLDPYLQSAQRTRRQTHIFILPVFISQSGNCIVPISMTMTGKHLVYTRSYRNAVLKTLYMFY